MLVSEPEIMKYTFCAIQGDEKPSWENQYLKVFEREAKKNAQSFYENIEVIIQKSLFWSDFFVFLQYV